MTSLLRFFIADGRLMPALRIGLAVSLLGVVATPSSYAQYIEATIVGGSDSIVINPVANTIYTGGSVIDGATNLTSDFANVPSGASTGAMAVNPVTNKVYAAVAGSPNEIAVINGATNHGVALIPLTGDNATDEINLIAVNPVTNTIYVFGTSSPGALGSVTVINGTTNGVAATVDLGASAQITAAVVNQTTNKLYLANLYSGNIIVLNGTTNTTTTVATGFTSPGANFYLSLAVNPVNNTIYVVSQNSQNMVVINGATRATSTVKLADSDLTSVAVNQVTNEIYVASQSSSNVGDLTIINGATNAVVSTSAVGNEPILGMTLDSVTDTVFLLQAGPPIVSTGYVPSLVTAINHVQAAVNWTVSFGGAPTSIALNAVTNKLYVTHYDGHTHYITVVDGVTQGGFTVPAGTQPVAVAVNPVTDLVYTADNTTGTVAVTAGATNVAVATVPVAAHPVALAVNPVTNNIYVASSGTGTMTIINGATNATSSVAVGSGPAANFVPQAVAVNPVTNKIYLANYAGKSVTVVDGATNATTTVPAGVSPYAIAVNATTNNIYVADINGDTVTVINGATNATATVAVGSAPIGLAVDAAANQIYVANAGSGTITVINGATNATSSVTVGSSPYSIAVDPVLHTVYVANFGSASVTVIDGLTLLVAATLKTDSDPNSIAVNPVTNRAYVTNTVGGSMTAINGAATSAAAVDGKTFYTQKVRFQPPAGTTFPSPYAVAVNPVTDKIYAADKNGDLFILPVDHSQTVPLTTVVAGVVDSSTVSTANVFQTRNTKPSFTVTVTSTFTARNAYRGVVGKSNPPPSAVYYKVDGGSQWSLAAMTSASEANPASFSISLSAQIVGPHTLYVNPVYGNDGASMQLNSPDSGNLTAYAFQIDPAL
jgi:YVTN family beta-propeller protein